MMAISSNWLPFGETAYYYETEAQLKEKISKLYF